MIFQVKKHWEIPCGGLQNISSLSLWFYLLSNDWHGMIWIHFRTESWVKQHRGQICIKIRHLAKLYVCSPAPISALRLGLCPLLWRMVYPEGWQSWLWLWRLWHFMEKCRKIRDKSIMWAKRGFQSWHTHDLFWLL